MLSIRYLSIAATAVLALGIAACDDDPVEPETLLCVADLGAATGVTTDATGTAVFLITGTTLTFDVESADLTTNVIAAHIHTTDGILVPDGANTGDFSALTPSGTGTGTITGLTQDQIDLIEAGDTYFNVHTQTNQGGEIEGDLVCEVS